MLWQGFVFGQDTLINLKTATVIEEKLPDAYKSTTIDSIATKQATNLSELLSNNTPVFVKTYGSGSLASVSFRGTGASHTSVLWNGVVLNSPMNGQVDFSLFPTPFIDNAELNYGASGLINGTGALGGSVSLNNQVKFNKGLSLSLQQSVGSFGNYISNAKIGYSNKKWFSESQAYLNTNKNDFEFTNIALKDKPTQTQLNAELTQYSFQQAIFRKFKNSKLGVRFWYFNSDRQLPKNMSVGNYTDAVHNETQDDQALRTMLEWSGFTSKLNYKITSSFLNNNLIYQDSASEIYSESKTHIFDNKINTNHYLKNKFTFKNVISVRYEQANADGFEQKHKRFNSHWLVGITKQFKRMDATVFNRMIMIDEEMQPFAPSLGLQYKLLKSKNLKIKSNAAINYNYPTFNDLYWGAGGNPDLKPEKSEMVELGSSYSIITKKTTVTTELTGFYSHVYDWIIWLPTSSSIWSPTNLREVENRGIEYGLKVKTSLNKFKISLNGNYAYTLSTNRKAKNDIDNSVNKQLIYVPYHQFNINTGIAYQKWLLNYNYTYTGKRYISTDNLWYMPANYQSNLSLSKTLKAGHKTQLNAIFKVNNLFNQEYQAIAWRAMPRRNYLFTLSLQFN